LLVAGEEWLLSEIGRPRTRESTMTDPSQRKEKKSETLEVRLPHGTKQSFLSACREDGTTASEVVRGSIKAYLASREQPSRQTGQHPGAHPDYLRTLIAMIPQPIRRKRWLAAGAGAAGLALFSALPSAAAPDFKAQFDKLDANHDGLLTADEFVPKAGPGTKTVMIKRLDQTEVEIDGGKPADGKAGKPEIKTEAFAIQLDDGEPGDGKGVAMSQNIQIRVHGGDGKAAASDLNPQKLVFDTYDGNHDGKLTLAEYEARQSELLTNGFKRLDSNNDGFVTEVEYGNIGQPLVIKINDGEVDARVAEALSKVASPEKLKGQFAKRDKNKDGRLSLAEYLD
jgi:Ca2+-binding EF-hand superfamily protein